MNSSSVSGLENYSELEPDPEVAQLPRPRSLERSAAAIIQRANQPVHHPEQEPYSNHPHPVPDPGLQGVIPTSAGIAQPVAVNNGRCCCKSPLVFVLLVVICTVVLAIIGLLVGISGYPLGMPIGGLVGGIVGGVGGVLIYTVYFYGRHIQMKCRNCIAHEYDPVGD